MSYAFVRDVPITESQYAEVRTGIEAETGGETPKGLVAHLAIRHESGLRYIDVWESEADWERFRDECVNPVVLQMMERHGIQGPSQPPAQQNIDVVHAWVGTSA
jgi:hypothetical protein